MDTLLPSTRAPLLKLSTGSIAPVLPSRTPLYVHSAPSVPVEQEKPDTARRANGVSMGSDQINWTAYPL